MGRLDGKSVIIAGATTGIGAAVAQKFAFEGALVLLAARPGDPVDDVASAIRGRGGVAKTFIGDLSQELTAKECVAKAVEAFGKLDILVHTAGAFTEMVEHQHQSVENFASLTTKYALPLLQETRGVVISMRWEAGEVSGRIKNDVSRGFLHAFITGPGRCATPEEMASVFAFIASGEASFVTGTLVFADGGHGPLSGHAGSANNSSSPRST